LARFQNAKLKLHFIAIPGGKYSMGLTDDEKNELTRLAKKHGIEEAKYFARDIAETARPAHTVKLPPFLCAQAPVTGAQGKKFTKLAELLDGHHKIYWYGAKAALQLTEQSDTRLLTEAEWEYIARAGGTQTWLSGEEDPQAYVQRIRSGKLLEDDHPLASVVSAGAPGWKMAGIWAIRTPHWMDPLGNREKFQMLCGAARSCPTPGKPPAKSSCSTQHTASASRTKISPFCLHAICPNVKSKRTTMDNRPLTMDDLFHGPSSVVHRHF
jgi:hypothetical protein